jgi:type IV pilus assembly protein PilC
MLIQELSMLLKYNIPLIPALDILAKQYPPKLQKLILDLKKNISNGLSLSQAMKKYPKNFEDLTIQLIRAGEETASLPLVLENISRYQEKIKLLKMRFKKALFYPVTVLSLASIITLGLLIYIVPQFEDLFKNMGAHLPWVTQLVLSLANFIKTKGLYFFAIFILTIATSIYFKQNLLSLPGIKNIHKKIIFSRFAHTLSLLLSANIPLTQSLKISSSVLQHPKYERAVLFTLENIIKGNALSSALQKSQQFPFIFVQFIHIGEQSGSLSQMLTKIGERYEMETDHTLYIMTLLLEPAIMIILGLLIGGLVVAMYLPIYGLGKII